MSSANCLILVDFLGVLSRLCSSICVPFISGLFVILIAKISTATAKRRALSGHPCRIPLSVENQLDNHPPFWIQRSVPSVTVLTIPEKLGAKLKMSSASSMYFFFFRQGVKSLRKIQGY